MSRKLTDLKLEARAAGERFFRSDEPCPRGHIGDRYASTGGCKECLTGIAYKPLNDSLKTMMDRYVFTTVVPAELSARDVGMIEAYLVQCMDHYCRTKGVQSPPYDMAGVRWAIANGRPLSERPK